MDIEWIEGATHYNPSYGGFFINAKNNTLSFNPKTWTGMGEPIIDYWRGHTETVAREGVAQPAVVEKPKLKRQIGWWQ